MKLIRVIQSKIVKKDNKYQVQSEKGKNLGTYDTKSEAEKRLKQVEMFKHMKKKSSLLTYTDLYKDFITKLTNNEFEWDIEKVSGYDIDIIVYDEHSDRLVKLDIDYELTDFHPEIKGVNKWKAQSDIDYYGQSAYYETFNLHQIKVVEINAHKVNNIEIPVDSPFGRRLYESIEEDYRYNIDY